MPVWRSREQSRPTMRPARLGMMVVTIGALGITAAIVQICVWSWLQGIMLAVLSMAWTATIFHELRKVSRPRNRASPAKWIPGPRLGLLEATFWMGVLVWSGVNGTRLLGKTGDPLVVTGEAWVALIALFHLLFLSICDLLRMEKGGSPYLSD